MSKNVHLRKYGEAATIDFDLFEVDGVDLRVDAVHASGDTTIMKNEGAEAPTSNGFTDEGNGYSIVLTATEMQAARIVVYVIDQTATKVWLDRTIVIETYGNASAQHAFDLDTASTPQTGDTYAQLPTNFSSLGIESDGDLTKCNLVATTTTNTDMRGTDSAFLAASAPTNFSAMLINVSGHVTRVTTCDTTTTNSDMRGTDGASTHGDPDPSGFIDAAISTRGTADAGDAMALTSGERTTLAAVIWDSLTSGMVTVGSIGKKLADWTIHSAADVWAIATRELTGAGSSGLATEAKQDTAQHDLDKITGADGATLATAQALYAPAKAGDAMALTSGERDTLAAAILDLADGVESGTTVREHLRLAAAALYGKSSGGGKVFRDRGDSKDRITATVDGSNNRTAVTLDDT